MPNSSRLGMNFPQTDMQALVAQQWQQRRDHRWRSSGGGGGSNSCMLGTGGSAAHNNPGGSMDFFLNMWEVYMPCGFWDGKVCTVLLLYYFSAFFPCVALSCPLANPLPSRGGQWWVVYTVLTLKTRSAYIYIIVFNQIF